MTDTQKLRELLAKATPGPWENSNGHIGLYIEERPEWSAIANVEHHPDQGASADEGNSNAALIVAAVNALPDLLDEVERLRKPAQELEATVKKLQCSETVLINMLRGTVARPSAGALPKLYSAEELHDAVRFAAAYNGKNND